MWLLVIVLLAAPVGVSRMTVLNMFATYEDCKSERDRIGFAMAESYPQESNFRIECALREQPPLHQPLRFERETPRPFTLAVSSLQTSSPQLKPAH
jgi:hypothetical protein